MTDQLSAPTNARGSGAVRAGDVWGGLAASAVVLPQAMAFGVALFAHAGTPSATGALAGLIAAAILSLSSGLAGGTQGLVTAPTGPTLVLLAGAVAALAGTGLSGGALLTGLAAVLMAGGLFQFLIGLAGGGKLIKFIPYPVVTGFMTGTALLMAMSQVKPLSGGDLPASWAPWWWIPAVTAAATYVAMIIGPRLVKAVPATIAGLAVGTAVFQILAALGPAGPLPGGWVIGTIPGITDIELRASAAALKDLPWTVVLGSALALSVLASLDTLLTSVIADVETGARHDARRELMGQGVGQILSGILGGMGGAGTTGATVVAIKSGGRRWAGVATGATFVLLVLFLGPAGKLLPISALAGIILRVAVGMVDLDVIAWLRRRRTRTDALITILVITVTVAYDLMVAVGVGVVLAVILFVEAQIQAPVIHRRSTAREQRSVRNRRQRQRDLLDANGARIVIYELRGNLFFATADRLLEELAADLDHRNWVIMQLQRVSQVDLTGIKILQQIAQRLAGNGGELLFSNVHKAIGLGHKVEKTFRKVSPGEPAPELHTFNDLDEALEYAENCLLTELGAAPAPDTEPVRLEHVDLCRDMTAEEITDLEHALRPKELLDGTRLFSMGDLGDELFIVLQGAVDILLPTTAHHHVRLERTGPGSFLGEVGFLKPGPRSAHAVAVGQVHLLVLDRPAFEKLSQRNPGAAVTFLVAISQTMAQRLRWSSREINRLAQW